MRSPRGVRRQQISHLHFLKRFIHLLSLSLSRSLKFHLKEQTLTSNSTQLKLLKYIMGHIQWEPCHWFRSVPHLAQGVRAKWNIKMWGVQKNGLLMGKHWYWHTLMTSQSFLYPYCNRIFFIRNVAKFLPVYKVSHFRRQYSSYTEVVGEIHFPDSAENDSQRLPNGKDAILISSLT